MRLMMDPLVVLAVSGLVCAVLGAGSAAGAQTPRPRAGDVVLKTDFSGPDPLAKWTTEGGPEKPQVAADAALGKTALRVERASATGATMVRIPIAVEALRGAKVSIQARVRAENVVEPPKPYNGIKLMLVTKTPTGTQYASPNNIYGTFDPKVVRTVATVPATATDGYLTVGLEAVSGRVWFTDIEVAVSSLPRSRPETPLKLGPADAGHPGISRLRGAMIGSIDEEGLKTFAQEWKGNVVRYQLTWGGFPRSPGDVADIAAYNTWIEGALKKFDAFLPMCEKYNVRVVLDLHTPPGGKAPSTDNSHRMFHDRALQERFVTLWEEMARRYQGRDIVWGFDLVNEPIEGVVDPGLRNWRDLALEAGRRIRAIDPKRTLIVEPSPGGEAYGFDNFEPLPLENVVYSFHFYTPHSFTHQGIAGRPEGLNYPGQADGSTWDREALRRAMQPAISFQKDFGVPLYVGEFSAIRWAPGDSAFNYLNDVISLFEEYGWDWTYHAFREFDGWSVEHGTDRAVTARSATPTDRETLMRHWFAQNERPVLRGIAPAEVKQVRGEKLKLSPNAPKAYHTGTRLKALEPTGPNSGIAARGSLIPESVVLRSGDTVLVEGSDYLLTHDWGMLGIAPGSRVTPNDTVTADYDYSLLRLDSVVAGADGGERIKTGVSHISSPLPPELAPGEKRIANLFVPYRSARKSAEVFPIFETAEQAKTLSTPGRIPKTMAKLAAGQPVKIVSWGDSVTAGGEASTPEMRFPNQLQARLREKFKSDKIAVETIAVGGSNSAQWLEPAKFPFSNPARQSELRFERVLEAKPDLVTIEFVNDVYMGADEFARRYGEIARRIQETGAEIIFITPHFTAMDMMRFSTQLEYERRPYVSMLQKFAAENNIALADASSRWGHLWKEGIPYMTLLHNTYNHPDDRGMALFADELMKCFAAR